MTTFSVSAISSDGGLAQYFREIWTVPLLEKEEEQILAERLRDHNDTDAAHQLVTSHLRLVAKIAMKYRNYGLPVEDLISEGNIGLMKAVRKFDPDREARLSTYAMWWIKASVIEYILKSWSMVKMGTVASQKKLFFSLSRFKAHLKIHDNREISVSEAQQISDATGVSVRDVTHMNRRISAPDFSLNTPVSQEQNASEFQEWLVDESLSQEEALGDREELAMRRKILANAIAELPERSRHIFTSRRLSDDRPTLEQLGADYGISRERARQIEVQAFKQVEKYVSEQNSRL